MYKKFLIRDYLGSIGEKMDLSKRSENNMNHH